jgi:ketosteroid isomerase-like protein
MSQDNRELVRRATQAFNDRDIPALELIYAEDFVFRLIGGLADMMGTEFRGLDAALGVWREVNETIDPRLQIEMIREVNDQVLAIMNGETTGAASGVATTRQFGLGQVFTFRDGRISTQDAYYTVDEALEAVGLEG